MCFLIVGEGDWKLKISEFLDLGNASEDFRTRRSLMHWI